ncbi:transcriptional attenuator, LytR family [Carnobacterium iners]|uniref:Transcriptional attenuator, LytR family n=1 Tax=Carnobacterium iners TaxID=1073423 RepID=A0A1X7MS19_9LACT|nr:LCP family protein [Carnobacterium iners]SEL28006.1 transcriptional attenuator, LytR family [Carnobacterium iners]SMH26907.1 transcriptional attenuator, LytR family [Carnobacterium iners]
MKNKKYTQLNTRRSSRKKKSKIILWLLVPLMVIILVATVYFAKLYATAQKAVDLSYHTLEREKKIEINPLNETTSILLMGIDDNKSRDIGSARADSLIYLTIDPNEHTVNMVSIPRDTYTTIIYEEQLYEKDKINSAYSKGEEQATIESVENLLNVPIHYYVTFNFDAFLEIIDALGGIEVDVPITFSEQNAEGMMDQIYLEKGLQTLNGEEALALARTRKIDNDVKRGERQQLLIQAITKKALKVGSIAKYSDAITAVGENMRTDIRFKDMLGIAQTGLDGKYEFESYVFDWTDFELNGASMVEVYPDSLDFISHRLRVSLGLDATDERDEPDYTFQTNSLSNYYSN